MNAFRQAMIMHHAVHTQVFDRNRAVSVYDLAAFLVREIITLETRALMHAGNRLAMFPPFWCAFCQFGMLALDLRKSLLFLAEKTWILYLFTSRECSKGGEAYINSDLSRHIGQAFWLALNREASIPLAGTALVDGERFDRAAYGAMVDHLDGSYLGDNHAMIMRDAKPTLRECEAVISLLATEAGAACFFTSTQTAEEGFHGKIDTDRHVLQDLRMHLIQGWAFLFQHWERGLLPIERETEALLLIGLLALLKQVVIEPAAFLKNAGELLCLLFGWVDPVLKHFTHILILCTNCIVVKHGAAYAARPFIPMHEGRAFWPLYGK